MIPSRFFNTDTIGLVLGAKRKDHEPVPDLSPKQVPGKPHLFITHDGKMQYLPPEPGTARPAPLADPPRNSAGHLYEVTAANTPDFLLNGMDVVRSDDPRAKDIPYIEGKQPPADICGWFNCTNGNNPSKAARAFRYWNGTCWRGRGRVEEVSPDIRERDKTVEPENPETLRWRPVVPVWVYQ